MQLEQVDTSDLHYVRTLVPQGYNPEVWDRLVSAVDDIIGFEIEIAKEQARNQDIRWLVAEALYDGYMLGLMDVVSNIEKVPGVFTCPEAVTERDLAEAV